MKYLYLFIWIIFAKLQLEISSRILIPINFLIIKLFRKTKSDYKTWKKNYNKATLDFPHSINDWNTFGAMMLLFYFPIILFMVKFEFNIEEEKIYIVGLFISITLICYYWIYSRSEEWLKQRIDAIKEKYYFR